MLVVGNILVAVFRVRLLEGLHAVHQANGGDIRRVGEHILHPCVARAADVDQHVGLVDGSGVRGRRLVGVGVHARADEQGKSLIIAEYLPGKVVTGKVRGDDAERLVCTFRPRRAGGEQQEKGSKKRDGPAHMFILPI